MKALQTGAGKRGGPLTRSQGCRIMVGRDILKDTGVLAADLSQAKRALLVSDENLYRLYGQRVLDSLERAGFQTAVCRLKPGQASKTLKSLQGIYEVLAGQGLSRRDLLIGLGGSAVCDLTGLAAATYMGGLDYLLIPGSLAAQAAGAAGSQRAVNLPEGRDLAGVSHWPLAVITDIRLLQTLPRPALADGMAEVIRLASTRDRRLFQRLEDLGGADALQGHLALGGEKEIEEIVWRCVSLSQRLAEESEAEDWPRQDFGQTIGRAIEVCWDYSCRPGEAAAAGMAFAAELGEGLGLAERGTAGRLKVLLRRFELPDTLGALAAAASPGRPVRPVRRETLPPPKSFGSFGSLSSLQAAAARPQPVSPGGLKGRALAEALRKALLLDRGYCEGQLELVYLVRIGTAAACRISLDALPLAKLTEA